MTGVPTDDEQDPDGSGRKGSGSGSPPSDVADRPELDPEPVFRPDPDRARRLLGLRVLLKSMLAIVFLVVVFVFFSVLISDDGEEDTLPGLRIAVGDMVLGETRLLNWDGRAVIVHRRTAEEIARLEDGTLRPKLRDPESATSEQPDAMRGSLRSGSPEWFVAIGLDTGSGCPMNYLPPEAATFADAPWPGGFVDGCRGSRYDLAGRVYAGQFADRNLVVPPHSVTDDGTLVLGR